MEKIKNHLLRDPSVHPTNEIISQGLGHAYKVFVKFADELKKSDITLMEWRYYNDGKAWLSKGEYKWTTSRGTNKIKPIFWLSIWAGFFRVAFFFSAVMKDELLSLSISPEAKEIIENAKPMGKTMRFIPIVFDITDNSLLNDTYVLAEFRKVKV